MGKIVVQDLFRVQDGEYNINTDFSGTLLNDEGEEKRFSIDDIVINAFGDYVVKDVKSTKEGYLSKDVVKVQVSDSVRKELFQIADEEIIEEYTETFLGQRVKFDHKVTSFLSKNTTIALSKDSIVHVEFEALRSGYRYDILLSSNKITLTSLLSYDYVFDQDGYSKKVSSSSIVTIELYDVELEATMVVLQ